MGYRMMICVLVLNFICCICQCQKIACINKLTHGWYEANCSMSNSAYIHVRNFRFGAEINCHGDVNLTALPHLSNNPGVSPSAYLLKILHCNLPNGPIKEIGSKVGVENITMLTLILVNNTTIQITHLHELSNLRQLTLKNAIVMNPDILEYVSKLRTLEIYDSFIPSLLENMKNMKMLNTFLASNTALNFSSHQYLNNQMQLTSIVVRYNPLRNFIRNPFRHLTSVTRFIIENNNIRNLSQDFFENYRNLRLIKLSGNAFTTLPKNLLANNKNLTTVHISNNSRKLKVPSGFFGNLPKLKELYTDCSNLAEVPEDLIWGSRSLKFLNFYSNRLNTLPQRLFRDSKMLRILILVSNQISQLPDGIFFTAVSLKRLKLSDNNLTEITEFTFVGLRELHELFLDRNKLEHIHMNAFSSLLNVQFIHLSYNRLLFNDATPSLLTASHGVISPFDKITSLSVLNLSHNQIQKFLRPRKVSPLFRYLDLSYNNISTLSVVDLSYQSSNVTVDLSHNAIHHIDFQKVDIYATAARKDKILKNLHTLKILFDNNPLHCDCQVYDFITYLKAEDYSNVERIFHIVPGNMSCASPKWMEGQSVANINLNHLICVDMSSLCPQNCTCWKAAHDKTYTINCVDQNLTKIPDVSKFPEENNIILNLTGNLFTETPLMNDTKFTNVTMLFLSNNNISILHEETIFARLQVLELHNNNMTTINEKALNAIKNSSSLTYLTLHGNPWKCGCGAKQFVNFIVANLKNFTELSEVKCSSGAIIAEIIVHQLCPPVTATIIISCLVMTISASILTITAALYYRHQRVVKIWLYNHQLCLSFVTEEEIDEHKHYDAFISYSHKDEDFVVKQLLKKLEQEPTPYKICVHFRDWIVGDWIPDQIIKSVEDSRRTLIVMSANFLESVWGRLELRAAHNQALNDTTARLIIIIYGDIGSIDDLDSELKTYISMNTYVKWGDPWFWEKLRYALPHSVQKHRHIEKSIRTTAC